MTRFGCSLLLAVSLASSLDAQLAGVYTVHPLLPTGGGNFATLGEAASALYLQGMAGPVTFQLFDDAGPYTESNSYTTIINPGTAVLALQGNLISGLSATNRLTFEPFPGEFPVLDATGRVFGVQMVTVPHVTIRGLEVFGATADGISAYADAGSGASGAISGVEIVGNRVHDIGGCGISIYANLGATAWFDGVLVRNNFVWRCQVTHGGQNNAWRHGYLNERRSINAVIEHNSFYADTGVGAQFGVIVTYYGAGVGGPASSLRNNLVFKAVANGAIYQHIETGGIATVMDGNLYDDPSGGSFQLGASGVYATLGDFQAANPTKELGSFLGIAALANPAGGDLHLTALSNARDSGIPIPAVTDDIDGDTRPSGPGVDIGADEYTGQLAQVIAVGVGCPGSQGIPVLGSTQVPSLGNLSFALNVSNAAINQSVYLYFTTVPAAATPLAVTGACSLYLDPTNLFFWLTTGLSPLGPLPSGTSGFVTFPIPVPNDVGLAGAIFTFQAAILDPGAASGFTLTNAAECWIN